MADAARKRPSNGGGQGIGRALGTESQFPEMKQFSSTELVNADQDTLEPVNSAGGVPNFKLAHSFTMEVYSEGSCGLMQHGDAPCAHEVAEGQLCEACTQAMEELCETKEGEAKGWNRREMVGGKENAIYAWRAENATKREDPLLKARCQAYRRVTEPANGIEGDESKGEDRAPWHDRVGGPPPPP